MKLSIVFALLAMTGCTGQVAEPSEATPAPESFAHVQLMRYEFQQCADYTGYSADLGIHCTTGDSLIGYWCQANGASSIGPASEQVYANGHVCEAVWVDSKMGGNLCAHISCEGLR